MQYYCVVLIVQLVVNIKDITEDLGVNIGTLEAKDD